MRKIGSLTVWPRFFEPDAPPGENYEAEGKKKRKNTGEHDPEKEKEKERKEAGLNCMPH